MHDRPPSGYVNSQEVQNWQHMVQPHQPQQDTPRQGQVQAPFQQHPLQARQQPKPHMTLSPEHHQLRQHRQPYSPWGAVPPASSAQHPFRDSGADVGTSFPINSELQSLRMSGDERSRGGMTCIRCDYTAQYAAVHSPAELRAGE